MNKDFHYEGTYCAAIKAGFSQADATYIANAAQMVDDCTQDYLREIKQYTPNSILTMESNGDFFSDMTKDLDTPNSPRLQQIRRIWMPFHFLPGNLSLTLPYNSVATYHGCQYGQGREEDDFRCMCRHSSELVKHMIDDTQQKYAALTSANEPPNSSNWRHLRSLVGIRMHVLADTWAHEFFTGTPSYWTNNAKDFKKLDGAPLIINETGSPKSHNAHSVVYLGHGRAGHYPDYGFLSYYYHPQWMADSGFILKNNPYNFKCAFSQMVDALRYIQSSGDPGGYRLKDDSQIMEDFQTLDNNAEISRIVESDNTDQSTEWRKSLAAELPAYVKDTVDMPAFQAGAALHLYLVKRYLERNNICYL